MPYNILDILAVGTFFLFIWLGGRALQKPDPLNAFKARVERSLNRKELMNLYFQLLDLYWAKYRGTNRAMEGYAVVLWTEERLAAGDLRDDARIVLELANHPNAPESYKTHASEWLRKQSLRLNIDAALTLTSALRNAAEEALQKKI